jgi:hypothetical protein
MPPVRDWPGFVLTPAFDEDWHAAGLGDEELAALCTRLVNDPEAGDVVPGAGALRKVRVALPGRGKSGGVRVGYAYYPTHGVILLALVYSKSGMKDLPAADRKAVGEALARYQKVLEDRAARRARGRQRRG